MSLLNDALYLADLHNAELTGPAIASKWGIGKSTVNDHRQKLDNEPKTVAAVEPLVEKLTGKVNITPEGGDFEDVQTTEPLGSDWSEVFKRFKLDPEVFSIVDDTVRMSMWQSSKRTENGARDVVDLFSYRARFTRKTAADIDLPALYSEAARTAHRPYAARSGASTTVVVFADPQVGKRDSRGGTPELIARLAEKRAKLEAYLDAGDSEDYVLADVGDGTESFENVASQAHLNDLSFPDQVDMYATERWKFETLLARYGSVDSLAVPSNHGAWRSGKNILGKPTDDWGIHVHKRLAERAADSGLPVTHHFPEEWNESLTFDIRGTVIGLHHGHQSAEEQMVKWWAAQQHGGQPLARAHILLTGHYHNLRIRPSGRDAETGRAKWHLQAPTLDNGSSWWRNKSGDDSDPGLMVFRIDENGFDLGSLTVL